MYVYALYSGASTRRLAVDRHKATVATGRHKLSTHAGRGGHMDILVN
jgi:hypothetical protein